MRKRRSGMSSFRFLRGATAQPYHDELTWAAQALADPARSTTTIGEVAVAHGFKSQAHFARIFRERYGLAPCGFRRESQG